MSAADDNAKNGKIVVKGREYPFPTRLSLGESVDVERRVADGGAVVLMAAMVWVVLCRAEPQTDPEEIWERVRELDLDEFEVVELKDPPKAAARKTQTTRGRSGTRTS